MQLFSQDVNWCTGDAWITCGLLWCFYQLLGLSFWRHPFIAKDPLVSKWSNAKFLQICSDKETNSSTSWMAWGWVEFQWILFFFGWTTPLSSWNAWEYMWRWRIASRNVLPTNAHTQSCTRFLCLPLSSRATYLLLLLKKGKHFSVQFAFPYAGTGATGSG